MEPIGQHRRIVPQSKGKRKKREAKKQNEDVIQMKTSAEPGIGSYLTLGFRSTHRLLEDLIKDKNKMPAVEVPQNSKLEIDPASSSGHASIGNNVDANPTSCTSNRLIAVIIDRSSQPPIMIQHLPKMLAAVARSLAPESPIWLVTLPNGSEDRLRKAIEIPRVGHFGILENAPNARSLLDYIKLHVEPVKSLNSMDLIPPSFLPLKVETRLMNVEGTPSKSVYRQQNRLAVVNPSKTEAVGKKRRTRSDQIGSRKR